MKISTKKQLKKVTKKARKVAKKMLKKPLKTLTNLVFFAFLSVSNFVLYHPVALTYSVTVNSIKHETVKELRIDINNDDKHKHHARYACK